MDETYSLGDMTAEVSAVVTCTPPCVPECTRNHPWENE